MNYKLILLALVTMFAGTLSYAHETTAPSTLPAESMVSAAAPVQKADDSDDEDEDVIIMEDEDQDYKGTND